MKGSLFKKHLLISSAIIVASFTIMGIVVCYSVSQYWINDKLSSLTDSARSLSAIASYQTTKQEDNSYAINVNTPYIFNAMAPNIGADAYVVDVSGQVLVSAYVQKNHPTVESIGTDVVTAAMTRGYSNMTKLGGLYTENQYVVGVPLLYAGTDETSIIGAVFLASSAESFRAFRSDIIQMCIIAAIFAAAISFLFSGASTYRLVMPLREMAAAAVAFGKGDFSQRVPVRSHDEMGELAQAFNNMASSLAESENVSRSFVANVSHELKTPMTTIAGFINGILDGTIPADRRDYYLRIVSNEVMRLSRLVRSMLDLSRIDSGKMKLRCSEFDMKEIVFDTMLSFETLINNRHINVDGMEDCADIIVNGDADLMHQVVYNLVENAVKFTNEGGTITVSVFERDRNAHVCIRNTGEGISQEELPLVFDRFYKTDKSRSNDKNGMGLGLYIVRTIIQLHGGEIEVRSQSGEYCEFEFFIPTAAPDAVNRKRKGTDPSNDER